MVVWATWAGSGRCEAQQRTLLENTKRERELWETDRQKYERERRLSTYTHTQLQREIHNLTHGITHNNQILTQHLHTQVVLRENLSALQNEVQQNEHVVEKLTTEHRHFTVRSVIMECDTQLIPVQQKKPITWRRCRRCVSYSAGHTPLPGAEDAQARTSTQPPPQRPPPPPTHPPKQRTSPKKCLKSQNPKVQPRRKRRKKAERDACETTPIKRQRKKGVAEKAELPVHQRIRTRFVLQDSEHHEPEPSISEGLCVWCKLRKYPFWPAMVKSVNRKTKKASIVFIDQFLCNKKTMCKGLSVSLRTLKPFDCCGSFVGSIVEYVADDISYPLRSEFLKASSDLLSPTQSLMEEQDGDCELQDLEEHPDLFQDGHMEKKVLPDRAQAARKRANQRLVDFIVRKQGAENRLLLLCVLVVLQAVISGQEVSRWLQALHSSSRSMLEQMYLEDDEQVDKVYRYLDGLFTSAAKANPALENSDRIKFILDVLFPEALIFAIAAVDSVSLEKAEEKYRQGPRHSNRERQEFDLMIEQQMRLKEAGQLL
ncbi:PWWP domain-containing protein MUM1L1 isoform X2 [Silurus asotus]|uniref:PWWP domain-containing protein MUM1L1 isoform X2 n=1 Tax=Silurus asotus TaxID=30991 RepID=A0AAD5A3K5_SILAS|nr:PWWP domain-containing protein MUM1L1 isoform X2 [Silurus asotus]